MLENFPCKIIFMADGDTDYLFLEKMLKEDAELSELPITMLRPEDAGLKRRTGGGHLTLLKEIGFAAIRAAQGHADGVFALVDNDDDDRFRFPHEQACGNCRECEAQAELAKITWGRPFKKGVSILFRALETLLLSAKDGFTPQIEEHLYGERLKRQLYGSCVNLHNKPEVFAACQQVLSQISIERISAKSYPRLKQHLRAMLIAEPSAEYLAPSKC